MKTILNIFLSMLIISFTPFGYSTSGGEVLRKISSCQAYCTLITSKGECVAANRLAVKTPYGIKVCKPCIWAESTSNKMMNAFKKAQDPQGKCSSAGYEDKYGAILQKQTRGPIDGTPWEWECKTYCQDNKNKDDCTSAPLAIIKTNNNDLKTCQACKWEKHMISKGAGTCTPTKTDTSGTYLLFEIHQKGQLDNVEAMCSHVYRNNADQQHPDKITETNKDACEHLPIKIDGIINGQDLIWSQYMQNPKQDSSQVQTQPDPINPDPNNP